MPKYFSTIILALIFSSHCTGQNAEAIGKKFIFFLNNYQTDSLSLQLKDNFSLERLYIGQVYDRTYLLEKYVPWSRNFNGKYQILKVISNDQQATFIVKDQSDYLTYLGIKSPTWKVTVVPGSGGLIQKVIFDSTNTYKAYVSQLNKKSKVFEAWLKSKYPRESNEMLYNTEGLLVKRLKEYSNR